MDVDETAVAKQQMVVPLYREVQDKLCKVYWKRFSVSMFT